MAAFEEIMLSIYITLIYCLYQGTQGTSPLLIPHIVYICPHLSESLACCRLHRVAQLQSGWRLMSIAMPQCELAISYAIKQMVKYVQTSSGW